jgi:hypothetical protein
MDVNGAKALKRRLGENGAHEKPFAPVDVPEDAPPVYRWTGVGKPAAEAPPAETDDDSPAEVVSMFRRLALSFR